MDGRRSALLLQLISKDGNLCHKTFLCLFSPTIKIEGQRWRCVVLLGMLWTLATGLYKVEGVAKKLPLSQIGSAGLNAPNTSTKVLF